MFNGRRGDKSISESFVVLDMKRNLLKFTYYWAEVGYPDPGNSVSQTYHKCVWILELVTKVHPKVRNHGEGPY